MKIVLDAFGGDNAPSEMIKAATEVVNESSDITVVLVGKESIIIDELSKYQYSEDRIEVVNASEIIGNDDSPIEAIRSKRDSSIVVGLNILKLNKADAFVSAGSTGAVLAGAQLIIKRIPGVSRAALVPVLPTVTGGSVIMVDCGANIESRPELFIQFAKIGNAFSKSYLNCSNPKIGLLNNGVEDSKGIEQYRLAHSLLKEEKHLNFIGNLEARDILSSKVDVVVCDGFDGNIALKASEGTALAMMEILKQGILNGGLRSKIGYILLKPVLKNLKKTLDYNDNGGAVFAGLEKIVVKTHGSSKAKSIKNAIFQARDLVNANIVESIRQELINNN